jgi:putative two-component system response regulator
VIQPKNRQPQAAGVRDQRARWNATELASAARRKLILTTLAFQTVTFGAAWYATSVGTRHQVASAVGENIQAQNVRIAETLGRVIGELKPADLLPSSEGLLAVQAMIDALAMSKTARALVIDSSGKLICRSGSQTEPLDLDLSSIRVTAPTQPGAMPIVSVPTGTAATGQVTAEGGQLHQIAVKDLPGLGAKLVVLQPETVMLTAGGGQMRSILAAVTLLGLAVLGATALATSKLIRRHDSELEEINHGLEAEVTARVQQSLRTRHALITGLAKLADYRDTDTGAHLDRIAAYSELLARRLAGRWACIDQHWIDNLKLASSLHDIGKVGICDSILLKPGKFTPEERRIMEKHAQIGAETLAEVRRGMGGDDLMDMCIDVARHHHERWDGKGYPAQLANEEIPVAARLVALADVYDALTSRRVYKDAMPHRKVVEIITQGSGTQFDPAVVEAFVALEAEFDAVRERLQPAEMEIPKLAQAA